MKRSEQEQELDITFTVRIKMFGKPGKHVDDTGTKLAQICGLNFTKSQVKRGHTIYRHETQGPFDTENYSGVSSKT